MQLQFDGSISGVAINFVRDCLSKKNEGRNKSQLDQSMAVDALGFLTLQVLIPMLVSLCSCSLYDILKGRVLAKLRHKEIESILEGLYRQTADTNAALKEDCVEVILVQLAPMGFTESEIIRMYKQMTAIIERHSKMPNKANSADAKSRAVD